MRKKTTATPAHSVSVQWKWQLAWVCEKAPSRNSKEWQHWYLKCSQSFLGSSPQRGQRVRALLLESSRRQKNQCAVSPSQNTCSRSTPLVSHRLPCDFSSTSTRPFSSIPLSGGPSPPRLFSPFICLTRQRIITLGIARRAPANESNQAVLSWWRSGSLIKP